MSDTNREPAGLPWVHVILARPSEARNIGASCRAMKNFGITRLTIVTSGEIDFDAARPLAVHADDLLASARIAPTLAEAVEHASLVAGTTRRLGQKRKSVALTPWELAATATERFDRPTGELAVVFGNEQSGLSDEELLECHVAVAIPTSPLCPSLNLSHAVEVICYELYASALKALSANRGRPGATPRAARTTHDESGAAIVPPGLTTAEATDRARSIVTHLDELGFRSQGGPQGMHTFLRDLIARAGLSAEEAERFDQLFAKLAGMHGRK